MNLPSTPATPVASASANDNHNVERDPVFAVMTAMTAHYAAAWNKTDELRALKREKLMVHYAWTSETIAKFKIGFDDGSVVEHLRREGFSRENILATGAFYVDSYNHLVSRFLGRIVFPYLDDAEVTRYFAARQTAFTPAWTKDGTDITPKYVKTKVHAETKEGEDGDGISPAVENIIWSTHERPKQDVGIIAEGIADAISAAQAGYAVRSPVTTQFKADDAGALDGLTRRWSVAVLVPDQEANGEGMRGAVKTAAKLIATGRDIRIAVLPHAEIAAAAVRRVEELRKGKIAAGTTPSAGEIKEAGGWKIDLNELLAAPAEAKALYESAIAASSDESKGKVIIEMNALRAARKEELRVLVESARPALELLIDNLPNKPSPDDWKTNIAEVTEIIAGVRDHGEREAWLEALKKKVGGSIKVLRSMAERDSNIPQENPVASVLTGLRFFRIVTGRVFTVLDGEAVPVDGEAFAAWVSHACRAQKGLVVSATNIQDATRAVIGIPSRLPAGIAPVRYAYDPSGNGIWVDLADHSRRYVHVTGSKVTIETSCPVAFYRPNGTAAMPVPNLVERPEECASVLADYWQFLCLDDEYHAALFAFIMSAARPMEHPKTTALTRYTVAVFNGEHGSGKTSRQMFVRRMIDPREPASMRIPDKLDDLTIYCEQSAAVSLDNQSGLSGSMSDALCRVATGDGNIKRSLYCTRDIAIFRGSRPILVNGITDVITRDDLLDRSLVIRVSKPEVNRTDDELEAQFHALAPSVLGALLYCMSEALANGVETNVNSSIRMLQAARWAASAEVAAGFESGGVEAAYLRAREEAVALAADDPFVTALLAIVPPGATWKGTMSDLKDALLANVEEPDATTGKSTKKAPRDFPATTHAVRSAFNRKQPALRALGLDVVKKGERTPTSSKKAMLTLVRKAESVVAPLTDDVSGPTHPITTDTVMSTIVPVVEPYLTLDDV